MKMIDSEQFLKIDKPVLYTEIKKDRVSGESIGIKYETHERTFVYLEIDPSCVYIEEHESLVDVMEEMKEGQRRELDTTMCDRDMIEDDSMYMIYENGDIRAIINALLGCIN